MIPLVLALLLAFGQARPVPPALPKPTAVSELRAVTLRFTPDTLAKTVTVAGQFNSWNKEANPLKLQPDGKTWSVLLALEPGIYPYKFVVNGDRWVNDPNAPRQDDNNGNVNSLLIVTPHGYENHPARVGDDLITGSGVRHELTSRYVRRLDRNSLSLTLRTRHNDVTHCSLVLAMAHGQEHALPMRRTASNPLFDYWRVTVSTPHPPLQYAFRLTDGPRNPRLYDSGDWLVAGTFKPKWFTLRPADFPLLETPDWVRDAVFYQIFPDRFANGDPKNDPPDVQPWGSPPTGDKWQGGDLTGVEQHFDHLRDLGVNALYFNPIFAARSNHGYDTTDYRQVDPRFGTNDELTELVAKAHTNHWRVILDGVFNHTGIDFAAFKSLREAGAKSPYRRWYFVNQFPVEVRGGQTGYVGWFGSPWMPKLNLDNPETRTYLLDIATRWITDVKIDGWRLDAADEVKHDYWQAFRRAVKAKNPNAYIVGEIWGNASDWLQGDQFDSVMNYRWRNAALDFFVFDRLTPGKFDAQLAQIRDDYPPAATTVMFNILDSHDTERLRTLCNGDWNRQRQAILFQMTYPGTPCIYYGDEIGLEGGRDPDDRRAMPWDSAQWNTTIYAFYKQTIRLRQQHSVLRRGDYKTLAADDKTGVFGFTRTLGKQKALILFNRSDQPQTVVLKPADAGNGPLVDWLGNDFTLTAHNGGLSLILPGHGIALLGR